MTITEHIGQLQHNFNEQDKILIWVSVVRLTKPTTSSDHKLLLPIKLASHLFSPASLWILASFRWSLICFHFFQIICFIWARKVTALSRICVPGSLLGIILLPSHVCTHVYRCLCFLFLLKLYNFNRKFSLFSPVVFFSKSQISANEKGAFWAVEPSKIEDWWNILWTAVTEG